MTPPGSHHPAGLFSIVTGSLAVHKYTNNCQTKLVADLTWISIFCSLCKTLRQNITNNYHHCRNPFLFHEQSNIDFYNILIGIFPILAFISIGYISDNINNNENNE